MELSYYKYMVYVSQYLLLYEILQIKNVNNYSDLPQEIKDKIPLSYDEWLELPSLKKSVLYCGKQLKYD